MFSFKQFTVVQEKSAMNVCTDSCLFGAVIDSANAARVLDIGTGTGLLALMVAQRSEAEIDAVEIDADTAEEAQKNFDASPWKKRLHLFTTKIQDFSPEHSYDLIISNPPFFKNSWRSSSGKRNTVMQQDLLPFEELLHSVVRLLSENGACWILLPVYEMEVFTQLAGSHQLYATRTILVRNRATDEPFRSIRCFEKKKTEEKKEALIIYTEGTQYSNDFVALLKPYYLKL